MSVKIRDVNFAVPAGANLEGDLGFRDALAAERLHKIVREFVRLSPERRAGINFRDQRALVEAVGDAALQIAIVAAADKILRVVRVGEPEALDVQIEAQHLGGFAGEAAHRNPNRRRVAGNYIPEEFANV